MRWLLTDKINKTLSSIITIILTTICIRICMYTKREGVWERVMGWERKSKRTRRDWNRIFVIKMKLQKSVVYIFLFVFLFAGEAINIVEEQRQLCQWRKSRCYLQNSDFEIITENMRNMKENLILRFSFFFWKYSMQKFRKKKQSLCRTMIMKAGIQEINVEIEKWNKNKNENMKIIWEEKYKVKVEVESIIALNRCWEWRQNHFRFLVKRNKRKQWNTLEE